jgi:glycosyltransferase involved in cell wall biosynthesis
MRHQLTFAKYIQRHQAKRYRVRSALAPVERGRLAVRSLRYVRHPDVVLRIFGEGPEQGRIARAAHRWGVADRVRFEGRVDRDELLRTVATAGVFLHAAFHDEAGLAVAEALSLGTPVVCLDRGGPPELLRYWPARTPP